MPQIIPAILEQTSEGFLDKVARVTKLAGVERIQVDFGDGEFIESKLLSATDINPLNPAFHWEAHLMCKEPDDFLDYKIAGFTTILIHYEAFKNSPGLFDAIDEIKSQGLKPGLVLNPQTEIRVAKEFEDKVSQFLIMGVVPGKQGQEFIPETLERISDLRKLIPNAIIEVDGGTNIGNVKQVAQAGADLIVAGSAIVKSADMQDAWDKLNAEIGKLGN